MEMMKNYDELCDKIHKLRVGFYRGYNLEPNVVNLGYDEFYALKNGHRYMVENLPKENGDYTIFGMKIKIVKEDSYLAVGFTIE